MSVMLRGLCVGWDLPRALGEIGTADVDPGGTLCVIAEHDGPLRPDKDELERVGKWFIRQEYNLVSFG